MVTKTFVTITKIFREYLLTKIFCYSYKIILWAPFCDRHKRNLWPSQNYFVIIYLQNILLQLQNYFVSGVLWLSQKHFVTVTKCVCNSHKTYFVTFTKAFCNYNKMQFVMVTIFCYYTTTTHKFVPIWKNYLLAMQDFIYYVHITAIGSSCVKLHLIHPQLTCVPRNKLSDLVHKL